MSTHTILVPAASPSQVSNLLQLVKPIAQATEARLTLLNVTLPFSDLGITRTGEQSWLEEITAELRADGLAVDIIHREGHNAAGVIRETAEALDPDLLVLSWTRPTNGLKEDNDQTLHGLLLDVPCDLVVWRGQDTGPLPRRILISSAGGPSAQVALDLAIHLRNAYEGEITILAALSSDDDNEAVKDTHANLTDMLEAYGEKNKEEIGDIRISVIKDRTPTEGILSACASANYDLLMIGASHEGVFNRIMFGEIPDRVARKAEIPVLVIKRPLPRRVTMARRAWDAVQERAPALTEAGKIEAYRTIRRSARADTDFFTMTALSTAIAALGLMLDSPAVVIGAMLVAPLMSAIVALGLAIVQGDAKLLLLAVNTTVRGIVVAVGIAFLMGLLIPGDSITSEMYARASPSLLDLAVALASGAAGAYALCRKDVSTSLPGVAIAVALVPPLATVGLALAVGAWTIVAGATILFLTNLVAIATMGGFVFLLLGFKPVSGRSDRIRLFTRGWGGLIILLIVVSVLLAWLTLRTTKEARIEEILITTLTEFFEEQPGWTLRDMEMNLDDEDIVHVAIEVESTHEVSHAEIVALQELLVSKLEGTVALTFKVIPTFELPPQAPVSPLSKGSTPFKTVQAAASL